MAAIQFIITLMVNQRPAMLENTNYSPPTDSSHHVAIAIAIHNRSARAGSVQNLNEWVVRSKLLLQLWNFLPQQIYF
jgi:hypothetical protein